MSEHASPVLPEEAWRRFVPVLWLMGILVSTSIAGSIVWFVTEDDSPRIDAWITGIDAVVILAFVTREWAAVRPALTRPVSAHGWALSLVVLIALGVFMELYFWLGDYAFETLEYLPSFRDHGWPPWSAIVLISVCPAIFEELAFRGFLLERLVPLMGQRDALLLQATLFSILHLSIPILLSHFVMGLGLGFVRLRTGSLLPGMLLHGVWNFWVLVQEGVLNGW